MPTDGIAAGSFFAGIALAAALGYVYHNRAVNRLKNKVSPEGVAAHHSPQSGAKSPRVSAPVAGDDDEESMATAAVRNVSAAAPVPRNISAAAEGDDEEDATTVAVEQHVVNAAAPAPRGPLAVVNEDRVTDEFAQEGCSVIAEPESTPQIVTVSPDEEITTHKEGEGPGDAIDGVMDHGSLQKGLNLDSNGAAPDVTADLRIKLMSADAARIAAENAARENAAALEDAIRARDEARMAERAAIRSANIERERAARQAAAELERERAARQTAAELAELKASAEAELNFKNESIATLVKRLTRGNDALDETPPPPSSAPFKFDSHDVAYIQGGSYNPPPMATEKLSQKSLTAAVDSYRTARPQSQSQAMHYSQARRAGKQSLSPTSSIASRAHSPVSPTGTR